MAIHYGPQYKNIALFLNAVFLYSQYKKITLCMITVFFYIVVSL